MADISCSKLEEDEEATKWCNQMLSCGGHDALVTDLGSDLADGVLLIKIMEVALGVAVPHYYATPIMKAQKLQNLQLCLNVMYDHDIQVSSIQADGLLAGDMKVVLAVCGMLKLYSETTGHHVGTTTLERSDSYGGSDEDTGPPPLSDEEDSLLKWVGSVVHRDIDSYSQLYDGQILCTLMNSIHPGAISAMELSGAAAPVTRLQLVNQALKEYLFISSAFDPNQVCNGGQNRRLKYVLQQCRKVLDQKSRRREMAARTSRKRSESSDRRNNTFTPSVSQPVPMTDIYLQGASSYTDLSSRRAEHENMIRGCVAAAPVRKHSSSEMLATSRTSYGTSRTDYGTSHTGYRFGGGLDRVQSMESGMEYQQQMSWHARQGPALARASSHSALQQSIRPFSGSTENIRTSLHSLQPARRVASVVRLDSSASDHVTQQLNMVEEKMELLTKQFLHERQDMFKQIMRTIIKERRKRQAAEKRLHSLEKKSRDVMCHYDNCLITMAKEMEELRSDVAVSCGQQGPASTILSREVQLLQTKVEALTKLEDDKGRKEVKELGTTLPLSHQHSQEMLFFRMRTGTTYNREEMEASLRTSYSRGSAASYNKVKKFFGEEPPRVESLESFLEGLGYKDLLPVFHSNKVGLSELRYLSDLDLQSLGLPLGQRVRILAEVKKLVPFMS